MSRQWQVGRATVGTCSAGAAGIRCYVEVGDVTADGWPNAVRAMADQLRRVAEDLDVKANEEDEREWGPMPVTVDSGYMGDSAAWCYWPTEYPDEGATGPFVSKEAARAHAIEQGFDPGEDD